MTTDVARYPELRQLCGAYLNADFVDEYGTVEEALQAYRNETGVGHRGAALRELQSLCEQASSDEALGEHFVALGCEVYFEGPPEVREFVSELRRSLAP